MNAYSTRKLTACAVLTALSFVGANIKVPGTSIAFDSLPAFLGALAVGAPWGMAVGFIGHLLTAMTSGFPLGLPVHAFIAVFMSLAMLAYRLADRALGRLNANILARGAGACAAGAAVNAPLCLLALVPILGAPACVAFMAPLSAVALANAAGGYIVYAALAKAGVLSAFGAGWR